MLFSFRTKISSKHLRHVLLFSFRKRILTRTSAEVIVLQISFKPNVCADGGMRFVRSPRAEGLLIPSNDAKKASRAPLTFLFWATVLV